MDVGQFGPKKKVKRTSLFFVLRNPSVVVASAMYKPLQLIYLLLLINFLILILLNNQDYLTVHNNQLATSSRVSADKLKFKIKKIKKKIFKKLKKKKMLVVPVPIKG